MPAIKQEAGHRIGSAPPLPALSEIGEKREPSLAKLANIRQTGIESMAMELFQYRDLVGALVARDLKVRYRRSAIGFLWTMLQPLLMMLVLRTVFSTLFQAKSAEVPQNYAIFALAG